MLILKTKWKPCFFLCFLLLYALPVLAQLPLPFTAKYAQRRNADAFHNADGSTRYSVEFGGGGNLPMGGTHQSQTSGGSVEGAFGINFNKYLALQARGEYDQMDVPKKVLTQLDQPKGSVQIASGTINAILRFVATTHFGMYVAPGGGYYRRVTKFKESGTVGTSQSDQITGLYTLNTYGGSLGFGVEWKPSVFSNIKIFGEARYTYLAGQTQKNLASEYDLNSRSAQFLPVLVGIRW